MTNLIKIHNVETNQVIEREMNEQELKDFAKLREFSDVAKQIENEKAAARQAILDRLGLTEDEAKILLG